MTARLVELRLADPPERWQALGFAVDHTAAVTLGGVLMPSPLKYVFKSATRNPPPNSMMAIVCPAPVRVVGKL